MNPSGLPVALAKWIPNSLNPEGGNDYRIRDCPRRVFTSICQLVDTVFASFSRRAQSMASPHLGWKQRTTKRSGLNRGGGRESTIGSIYACVLTPIYQLLDTVCVSFVKGSLRARPAFPPKTKDAKQEGSKEQGKENTNVLIYTCVFTHIDLNFATVLFFFL